MREIEWRETGKDPPPADMSVVAVRRNMQFLFCTYLKRFGFIHNGRILHDVAFWTPEKDFFEIQRQNTEEEFLLQKKTKKEALK